jgi:excinuclease ABC subunit A
MTAEITIRGARLHNLKNISLSIPKNKLVVLTGLSGSGKSTLGFDILCKEGQRQYLESLGLLPFGVTKPPVESISGLSPTISIDQNLTHQSPRSTVGTVTEVYTYLRVLFARLGHRPCPACRKDIPPLFDLTLPDSESDYSGEIDVAGEAQTYPCPHCAAPIPELDMANFSFNKPEGACPTCTGLGSIYQADFKRLVDEEKSISQGAVYGWERRLASYHSSVLLAAGAYYGFEFDLDLPVNEYPPEAHDLLYYGVEHALFRRHFPDREPPATAQKGRFEGLATSLLRRYAERITDGEYRARVEELLVTQTCPDCLGMRLKAESRQVRVGGETISDLARLSLGDLGAWLEQLSSVLKAGEMRIAAPILSALDGHIAHLVEAGAGYLTLERSSPSLSAGEAQRLRLAALLGSGLTCVLYIFDEPTIGLHARDTGRMIRLLLRLRDLGNTVLVIEHDLDVIAAADYVVDLGPGAGKHGGRVVAAGTPDEIARQAGSLTGDYLARRVELSVPERRRAPSGSAITIHGARHHNLKDITVSIPLGLLVAVTGVSGSGKSSLIMDILARALRQRLEGGRETPGEHDAIDGNEHVDKIILIDQTPIGRMPRSNTATYADVFTPIRAAFAATALARQQGFSARHFSFNVPGGRCERCEGAGVLKVNMHFLPDVEVRCPICHGRRFTRETLSVQYQGFDIAQVLDMTIEEALALFEDVPAARARLQVLSDVGLGYLQLGQPATSLSGGEAQRVKLAKELGRRSAGHTLYLLDEPTTGLHLADVRRLLDLLQRLVEAGQSVIVIEHNLELVKAADWVIDLGPEGGAAGGQLVAQGTPEQVARAAGSFTGQWLSKSFRSPPGIKPDEHFSEYPGTKQHQAVLSSIVAFYQDDPRILAVIVFGSLGRGDWDKYSDVDLDVIVADDIRIDISDELRRLCKSFAGLNERAAIIIPDGDEGDIVLESLMQLSIRYHPLSETSPNILDSMLVLAGSLDKMEIAAAGNENRSGDAQPLSQLLDRCVRYAVEANVQYQRKHFWAANEVLHRAHTLLMDIYARTHSGYRGYQFFDINADKRFQERLGVALPAFDDHSLLESLKRTLDIIGSDLSDLSAGQLGLTKAQKTILDRVRQQIDSNAARAG